MFHDVVSAAHMAAADLTDYRVADVIAVHMPSPLLRHSCHPLSFVNSAFSTDNDRLPEYDRGRGRQKKTLERIAIEAGV